VFYSWLQGPRSPKTGSCPPSGALRFDHSSFEDHHTLHFDFCSISFAPFSPYSLRTTAFCSSLNFPAGYRWEGFTANEASVLYLPSHVSREVGVLLSDIVASHLRSGPVTVTSFSQSLFESFSLVLSLPIKGPPSQRHPGSSSFPALIRCRGSLSCL